MSQLVWAVSLKLGSEYNVQIYGKPTKFAYYNRN